MGHVMVEWWVRYRITDGNQDGLHGPFPAQSEAELHLMQLPLEEGDEAWTVKRTIVDEAWRSR